MYQQVSLVQWSSRLLYTQKVAGSNPAGNINIRFGEERSNQHVLGIKYRFQILMNSYDSLQINLEGFPSLQLTFYHTKRKLMLNVVPKRWRHMYKLDVSTYNGRIEKQKGKRTVNSTYLFGLTFNRSSFLEGKKQSIQFHQR